MRYKLMPSERRYLSKIHNKCMNNDEIGIMRTDSWAADIIRSLRAEGSVKCLAMAELLELDYTPYHVAITTKKVDRDEGTLDVDAFKDEQKSLTAKLKMLEAKIMVAMPDEYEPVLKNLDLNNIKVYNKGAQAEQVLSLEVLRVKIHNFPPIADLVAETGEMVAEVKAVYEAKENQFKSIKIDATNVQELKSALAETILKVFGQLTDYFSATPAKVMDFFNLELVNDDVRSEDFLYINQYALQGYQGTIMHADTVDFDFGDFLTVECEGPLAIDVYLTSVIDNVISVIAKRIEPGTTETFAVNTIGASTQRNLMIAFAHNTAVTEACKVKITVNKKK